MHQPIKIVVSGPVGAGKTTLIRTLSETEVVSTDELASEEIGKKYTTVAMDFGSFHIEDYPIYLFGTPGQERFDFMWEVLCEGAVGLLVLVNATKVSDFSMARKILDYISSRVPVPYMLGITHLDSVKSWEAEDIANYFQVPTQLVVGLDARDPQQGLAALYDLFAVINSHASVAQE
jgi:small GTP-binding protein